MILTGKMLMRKSTTLDGNECVIICGCFLTTEENLAAMEGDEMWIGQIQIGESIKYSNPIKAFSPEEFLEGEPQKRTFWKNRKLYK